ncbi:MAG: hypothetical protein H6741_01815 [Alphaproteobacteria bacterium]|nr:hypothetical protein [Alphaproteobacteria bacterium]MCB9791439.1 hypothetical protein [Alphaproteobacteria bacterium]
MLLRLDAAIAKTRPAWIGLGQLSVAILGVHLAADRLDDLVFEALVALSGAAINLISVLGVTLPEAGNMETPAAWTALVLELLAVVLMFDALTFSAQRPELSWDDYRASLSPHAVALPLFWAPVSLAGAWVVGMATEDLLAPYHADLALAVGVAAGLLVAWRLSWTGLKRVIAGLGTPKHRWHGLTWSPLLLGFGGLAFWYGLPIRGWLPW